MILPLKVCIVHRFYSTSEGDSIFRCFDVFIPTGDGYSMVNPLNPLVMARPKT